MSSQPPAGDRQAIVDQFGVPRETMARLDAYVACLIEWQQQMNLVGPATLDSVWTRHVLDSAQLLALAPLPPAPWIDLGSGAGFPGLVIAIMGGRHVTMVEATAKKCEFLAAAARAAGVSDRVEIVNQRIEHLSTKRFAVISARALAPLPRLFDWGRRFADEDSVWLLPKGVRVNAEILSARQRFAFEAELVPSLSDPAARIVVARRVTPRKIARRS